MIKPGRSFQVRNGATVGSVLKLQARFMPGDSWTTSSQIFNVPVRKQMNIVPHISSDFDSTALLQEQH